MEPNNFEQQNNVTVTPDTQASGSAASSSITPLKLGLYFGLIYAVIITVLYMFGMSIGNSIFAVVLSPASSFLYMFGLYAPDNDVIINILLYIVANALVYFLIGTFIGRALYPTSEAHKKFVPASSGMPGTTPSSTATISKLTPGKLTRNMFFAALGWAISGLLLGTVLGGLFAVWMIIGVMIVAAFALVSLSESIQSFRSGNKSQGIQYLLLIIVLPVIGIGVGCGTCLFGASVLGGM